MRAARSQRPAWADELNEIKADIKSYKEEIKEMAKASEDRHTAYMDKLEDRHTAYMDKLEARLAADRRDSEQRLAADRRDSESRFERAIQEFKIQRRWLIATFFALAIGFITIYLTVSGQLPYIRIAFGG